MIWNTEGWKKVLECFKSTVTLEKCHLGKKNNFLRKIYLNKSKNLVISNLQDKMFYDDDNII